MTKYKETKRLLDSLYENRKTLTQQQKRTIRGQIRAGDFAGAEKGLHKLMFKELENVED